AASVDAPGRSIVVANSTGRNRAGVVSFTVPGAGPLHLVGPDGVRLAAQVAPSPEVVEMEVEAVPDELDHVLDLFGPGVFAGHAICEQSALEAGGQLEISLRMGAPTVDLGGVR